jgi:primosomal protein N' (replication factor Y) (superfamily II helicase)
VADPGAYAAVALNRPIRTEFTYAVPQPLRSSIAPGARVVVPFATRREVGVCVRVLGEPGMDPRRIRPLERLLDEEPILPTDLLELARWIADETVCSWGQAIAALLPASLKRETARRTIIQVEATPGAEGALASLETDWPKQFRVLRTLLEAGGPVERVELLGRTKLSWSPVLRLRKKGWVRIRRVPVTSDPLLEGEIEGGPPPRLTPEQEAARDAIAAIVRERRFGGFLLFGVTGSGKTEVYLRALEATLAAGRSAIVLVPEISLTPQTVARFRGRFGEVAVLHSRLTDAQRFDQWRAIREGKARVVVGARSAVFAPVRNLGLVVVDEEHEPSFKQQQVPRYHARDVARRRAEIAEAALLLGSATPSLEAWRDAQEGRARLLRLPHRVGGGSLPEIRVVDLRRETAPGRAPTLLSRPLLSAVRDAVRRREQAILFLNRRGFAPVLYCPTCAATVRCDRCDASLTYHRRHRRAVCHLCGEEEVPPTKCPECTAGGLLFLGAGSERVEDLVRREIPGIRVARMDSDTMVARGAHEGVLGPFRRGEIDALVGTQMIAKGLDFPNVTVVGVVSADTALHLPDFRSTERTFQLISQVAGRAGRGPKGGVVFVQTHQPEQDAIGFAVRHEYEAFAREELEGRRSAGYPPFVRAVRILVEGKEEDRVRATAVRIRDRLLGSAPALEPGESPALPFEVEERPPRGTPPPPGVQVLGPAPAPIARIRGRARWHLLAKLAPPSTLAALRAVLHEVAEGSWPGCEVTVDVDPVSVL